MTNAQVEVLKPVCTLLVLWLLTQGATGQGVLVSGEEREQTTKRSGKIAPGTDWETDYHIIDSGVRGATVLIIGGMHGNEPAGSRVAEQILHWPIVSGRMVAIPRANMLALEANTRLTPGQTEEDGNLNRNFPQTQVGEEFRAAPRGELAAALWGFAMKVRPDWTIDIHEGFDFHRSHNPSEGKKKSVGSSVIYQGSESMDALMKRVVAAADTTVTDPEKRFSLIRNGPVSTGFARACIRVMGAEGVILETTYKNQPMSLRTRQHRAMVNELLNHIGLIDTDCRNLLAGAEKGEKLQVAVLDGTGVGSSSLNLGDVIDDAPGLELCHVGPAEMKVEVLEQFDVLVFPGGSGSKQAAAIGENGRLSVRQYVERGGGVLGICAGAYLCSSHYQWSLNLIDSSVLTGTAEIPGKGRKQLWFRGPQTDIDIELSPAGERMFAGNGIARNFVVRYANGPIISPKQRQELEDYEVLAWFRSENGLWKPQEGTMINTPAIVSGRFGKGRVISMSPHPELTPSLHPIITEAIRWVAGPEK